MNIGIKNSILRKLRVVQKEKKKIQPSFDKNRAFDYDYIIIGAGLSGLALAKSIVELKLEKRVALVDARHNYVRDHIWSCWDNVPAAIDSPFDHSWSKWKVKFKEQVIECDTKLYPYKSIFAESYYSDALKKLQNAENVELFMGESVEKIEFDKDMVSVKTTKKWLTSDLVFDSRPGEFDPAQLKQDFLGIEIFSEAQKFDPSCLTLMDFSPAVHKKYGFHFNYVLPFSPQQALVESVFVGFDRLSIDEHREQLSNYLRSEFDLKNFQEIHVEHGCIPMHTVKAKPADKRHYLIGTPGGLVRPSTGYAFAAIQEFSKKLAESLKTNQFPELPRVISNKSKLLDAILLAYLKKNAADAPLIFSSLFQSVSTDAMVRFLCDASTLEDDLKILAAMPRKLGLTGELARICFNGFNS